MSPAQQHSTRPTPRRGERTLSTAYRRFLAIQLCVLFLSLSISEEGNLAVYAIKLLATALPGLSLVSLYLLHQNVGRPLRRNLQAFRHIWLLMGMGLLSCAWAADGYYSLAKVIVFAATFISLSGILIQYEFLPPSKRESTLTRHLLYACLFLLVIMAFNYYVFNAGKVTGPGDARHRAGGNLVAPTNAAATVGLALLISLHHLLGNKSERQTLRLRRLAGLTLAFSVWALLALSTRAAFLCTVGALLTAPILAGGLRVTYKRLILASGLIALIALAFFNLNVLDALLSREQETASVWTLSGRTWLWARAFQDLTLTRAFLGYGYAAISESVGIRDWWTGDTSLAGAHNAYLQVFLGMGILGLLVYLRFLFGFFKLLRSKVNALPQRQRVISFAFFLYFISFGITEHLFGLNVTPTFFLICAIHTMARLRVTEHAEERRRSMLQAAPRARRGLLSNGQ